MRAQDLTSCQVPTLTNYQGKNSGIVTFVCEIKLSLSAFILNFVSINNRRKKILLLFFDKAVVRWCLAVDTKWSTQTLRGQVKFAFGDATFSWVSSIWKTKQEKRWMKMGGCILETWGR